MSLVAGQSLSFYEILGPLGAGAMGEVYLAKDTRLDREVAIKVLPEHFAEDEERLRRFEREAKTLASLNHPNVAGIHGIDQVQDMCFIAMELVEGEDLAMQLSRGALPVDEALDVCRQIAEGLEAAHDAGVIHRDLKPANVRITPEGKVKVLDFGLAKPMFDKNSGSSSSAKPDSFLMTQEGVVLGTPTYMSPEQARGKPVDRRTDIWAFGCVLFECLTGKRPFEGDAFGDLMVSILEREPDFGALPAATPAHIRRLLQRTLTKDPHERLRDIGEARVALCGAQAEAGAGVAESTGKRASRGRAFALGALTLGLPFALWVALRGESPHSEPGALAPSLVFEVSPPADTRMLQLAISPDGESIVFTAENASGEVHMWLRDLRNGETRRLEGTLGAGDPFWSPDSRSLGFFSENRLMRTDVETGMTERLRRVSSYRGGAWSRHGQIVHQGEGEQLLQVTSLQTGASTPATIQDTERGENNHRFPVFLPDGKHLLYYSRNAMRPELAGLYVAPVGPGEAKFLGRTSSSAVFAEPGYLLYRREVYLMAQAFDVDSLSWTGDPITLADDLWYDPSITAMVSVSVSRTGTLVYRTGGADKYDLVWFDRSGQILERVGEPDTYLGMALSPDGRQLLVGRPGAGVERYMWLFELNSGSQRQLTFSTDAAGQPWFSPDGERAILGLVNGSQLSLFEKQLSSGADPVLLPTPGGNVIASDWPSKDLVIYNARDGSNQSVGIYLLNMHDGTSQIYKESPANERFGVVSPNGRWIAYSSDQTGRFEVHVESFPEPGRRWRISAESGFQPRWHPDGSELFFLTLDRTLMSAQVVADKDNFEWSQPEKLFRTEIVHLGPVKSGASYLVSPDGECFLIQTRRAQTAAPAVAVLNWTKQLEDR